MPVVQIYITSQARQIYNINLPNGLYELRMTDFCYVDTVGAGNHTLVTVRSDTWRIPYGNASQSNRLLFVNKNDNGRPTPQGTINFLAEVRNGQMDIELTGVVNGSFSFCIITFDAQNAKGADNFFPLM
jgi:hypothetical protein